MTSLQILAIPTILTGAYAITALTVDLREARRRTYRLEARVRRAEARARDAMEHATEAQECLDLMLDVTREQRIAEAKERHPASRPVRHLIAVDGGRA